jgi:hypothetical protein
MKKWTSSLAALALLASGGTAQACTIGAWDAGVGGITDADTGLPGYEGSCGLTIATNGVVTGVRDESHMAPAGEPSYIARFMALLESATTNASITNGVSVSVLKGYSGAPGSGTEEFDVSIVGATGTRGNVVVNGTGFAGASTPIPIPNNTTWNAVEIRWSAVCLDKY